MVGRCGRGGRELVEPGDRAEGRIPSRLSVRQQSPAIGERLCEMRPEDWVEPVREIALQLEEPLKEYAFELAALVSACANENDDEAEEIAELMVSDMKAKGSRAYDIYSVQLKHQLFTIADYIVSLGR
jgi:hypothetical protein